MQVGSRGEKCQGSGSDRGKSQLQVLVREMTVIEHEEIYSKSTKVGIYINKGARAVRVTVSTDRDNLFTHVI